jgi:CRISPR-associated endonuclease/helicase Cas3
LCQLQGYYIGVVPTMAFLQLWGIYCCKSGEFHLQLWPILFYNTYIDVLFLYNEEAEEAYEEYKEIIKLKSFQEKREKYLEVGQVFKNYTLSIPQKYCRSFVEENGLLILPREGIDQYYDEDTGFIRNDTDTYMIF